MLEHKLRQILEGVRAGSASIDDAVATLRTLPFEELGYATVDHHRALRLGFPEVVLGSCKTAAQIAGIAERLRTNGGSVLVTRIDADRARAVQGLLQHAAVYHDEARVLVVRDGPPASVPTRGPLAVVTAGTGDIPVAEEAAVVAEEMGNRVVRMYDVGVAGIHRVLSQRAVLEEATAIVVCAGMEGALASVIGGLVARPVIAVPTSVGYGASFSGVAALLGMLNSCAAGVSVVNIDNGFGAAYLAALINRQKERDG